MCVSVKETNNSKLRTQPARKWWPILVAVKCLGTNLSSDVIKKKSFFLTNHFKVVLDDRNEKKTRRYIQTQKKQLDVSWPAVKCSILMIFNLIRKRRRKKNCCHSEAVEEENIRPRITKRPQTACRRRSPANGLSKWKLKFRRKHTKSTKRS